jgi:NADH-quinone oxidoreductase subunit L
MFIAVGVGDYTAGVFHLLTHGFFKALLFLAAGSVMHAMANQTDVRSMGGLARALPVTCATSLVGVLAISGLPPLSGYFSKEEVLASAAETSGGEAIWLIGVLVAGLTAFYMVRWFMLVFLGRPRWQEQEESALHPHESPTTMAAPLVVLAIAAALGGLLNLNSETGFLHGWLEPSVVAFEPNSELLFGVNLNLVAILAALAGVVAAINLFREPYNASVGETGGMAALARRRFYVDEAYQVLILWPGRLLAQFFVAFDTYVVDGTVNGLARATGGLATVGRRFQTGFVRSYALAVLTGAVLVTVLFLSSYLVTTG